MKSINNLINEYHINKNDYIIKHIVNIIISKTTYLFKPTGIIFVNRTYGLQVKNNILEEYQHLLDYDILSQLIYKDKFLMQNIDENHKHYKELKELFKFLTL